MLNEYEFVQPLPNQLQIVALHNKVLQPVPTATNNTQKAFHSCLICHLNNQSRTTRNWTKKKKMAEIERTNNNKNCIHLIPLCFNFKNIVYWIEFVPSFCCYFLTFHLCCLLILFSVAWGFWRNKKQKKFRFYSQVQCAILLQILIIFVYFAKKNFWIDSELKQKKHYFSYCPLALVPHLMRWKPSLVKQYTASKCVHCHRQWKQSTYN